MAWNRRSRIHILIMTFSMLAHSSMIDEESDEISFCLVLIISVIYSF
jgi:hypothetical protein